MIIILFGGACILLFVTEPPHCVGPWWLVAARLKSPALTHLSSPGVGAEEWDIEGDQPHPDRDCVLPPASSVICVPPKVARV